jgi:hypothetical protein
LVRLKSSSHPVIFLVLFTVTGSFLVSPVLNIGGVVQEVLCMQMELFNLSKEAMSSLL